MMRTNKIFGYDMVNNPGFGNATLTVNKRIEQRVLDFYSRYWRGGDFSVYKNFGIGCMPYKISFIVGQILNELEVKTREDEVRLELLYVVENGTLLKQVKMDLYDEFHRRGYNVVVGREDIIGDGFIIDIKTVHRVHMNVNDLHDIVITDIRGLERFIDKFSHCFSLLRRNGCKMVKLVSYIDSIEQLKGLSGFDLYDLSKISDEGYVRDLRGNKLKRILGDG